MNRKDIDWHGVLFVVLWMLVFALILMSMGGCSMGKEYEGVVRTDTVYVVKSEVRVDSVWRDRYRNVYVSGDTVHDVLTEYLTRYVYRDRVDTLVEHSVDSVVSVREVSVARERSGYDRFCSWAFWIMVVLVVGYLVYRVVKWLR